jgi:CheY-like chemotaxis protein
MVPLLEKMRVLIVDDKREDQELGASIVTECVPDAAITFASEYESALPLLLNEYFDFVLLDLVLHEDAGPEEGWEGPWLLQDLLEKGLNRYVPVVILTNFSRAELATSLFKNFQVTDFWAKSDPKDKLVASLQRSLSEGHYFGLVCGVKFKGGVDWRTMAASLGFTRRLSSPISPEDAELELKHIVRKLFAECKEVSISPLGPENEAGNSGAGVCVVTPFSPEDHQQADVILKFGTLDQISQERDRWSDIRKYMKGFRLTQLESIVLGRQLGALTYSLVGAKSGQVQQFAQYYGVAGVDQIKSVLRTLFEDNFSLCYESKNRSNLKATNIQDLYASYLGFTSESLRQAFLFKYPDKPLELPQIQFMGVPRRFAHPIAAFYAHDAEFSFDSWTCRTHGDLHTGNILVDTGSHEPWLIDFGRAGVGHWARDLVALEASVKFQHIPSKDLSALFELEAALVKPDDFAEEISYHRDDQPELCKAAAIVKELRRIAGQIYQRPDRRTAMVDYYSALFYQTINYIRLHKLIKSPVRKNQVLLSAALLFEKLKDATK